MLRDLNSLGPRARVLRCKLAPCTESVGFGFRSFGLLSDFGFRISGFVRPNRHKMIPLLGILANHRFERTHDRLRKLLAGLAIAQSYAVVRYLRHYMRPVPA